MEFFNAVAHGNGTATEKTIPTDKERPMDKKLQLEEIMDRLCG